MQNFLVLFSCIILVSGCSTTGIWFINDDDISDIALPEPTEPTLTNAPYEPNLIIQDLNPVPIDEPIQIIAPDTSLITKESDSQIRS